MTDYPLPLDAFFPTLDQAQKELSRRKSGGGGEVMTKIDRSPYGGYRVRSVPVELYVDMMTEGMPSFKIQGIYRDRKLFA